MQAKRAFAELLADRFAPPNTEVEPAVAPLGDCTSKDVADWIFEHYDLAPKDTLGPLKDAVTRLAFASREY